MALKLSIAAPGAAPQEITLDQPRVKVGRGATVDVRLPSRAVSEVHAVFHVEVNEVALTDEGSTNGTRVNGVLVPAGRRKTLRDGDVVCLADYSLTVRRTFAAADPAERTASVARRLLLDALRNVGSEAAPPRLVLANTKAAGRAWTLPPPGRALVIGRGDGCDVVLDDRDCSRQHAEVTRDEEGAVMRDLGSRNGLVVHGRGSTERRLRNGDEVTLGRTVLRFVDPAEDLLRTLDGGEDQRAPTPAPPPPPRPPEEPVAAPPEAETHALPRVSLAEPARGSRPSKAPSAPPPGRTDWVVVVLAAVILIVSLAATAVVLRGR